MSNISKVKVNNTTYDLEDITARTSISNLATVATSGSYTDLSNKPTIPTISATYTDPFNKLTVGTKSFVYGFVSPTSITFSTQYGGGYFVDYSITIPANARLTGVGYVNVQTQNVYGLIGVNILSVTTSTINMRLSNLVSGSFDVGFYVEMIGD